MKQLKTMLSKYQNESATGIPVFPILNPPPSSQYLAKLIQFCKV